MIASALAPMIETVHRRLYAVHGARRCLDGLWWDRGGRHQDEGNHFPRLGTDRLAVYAVPAKIAIAAAGIKAPS